MEIFLWIAIFMLGFAVAYLVERLRTRKSKYGGDIIVTYDEGKTIYSLVLNEDPETLRFRKDVIFKIENPGKES